MQSPWGDGNSCKRLDKCLAIYLRNAVPVRGRKRVVGCDLQWWRIVFEKCSPREGTETSAGPLLTVLRLLFEKCSPREGTETPSQGLFERGYVVFEKCSPREGTETVLTGDRLDKVMHLRNAVPVRGRKRVATWFFMSFLRIWEMQSP